jgi:hypothetical protein
MLDRKFQACRDFSGLFDLLPAEVEAQDSGSVSFRSVLYRDVFGTVSQLIGQDSAAARSNLRTPYW